MMLSGRAGLLALLLAGAPGILGAEGLPAAVGRISYGEAPAPGAAICTGALVATGLVLTAAHCVQGAADPGSIRFDAGWSGGRPAARRRGAAVILPGGPPVEGMAGLAGDVALVVLEAPFPPGTVAHLPLANPAGEAFTLIAFDRTAPDRPSRSDSCGAIATAPGLMGLGCAVVSGNSGAPLLEADGKGGWHIVAVMVAASRAGPVRSWAALPPDGLRARILSAGE